MPEGHSIHRLARDHHRWFAGQSLSLSSPQGRFVEALRNRLGPDPLDPAADADRFSHNLSRRRRAIGAALLDQGVVAGIGNVYRAELLFLCRLNPTTPCNQLAASQVDHLWSEMVRLLPIGVRTNRIITTVPADFDKTARKLTRKVSLWVYKRARCRMCSSDIATGTSGNRTLYWCPECQA